MNRRMVKCDHVEYLNDEMRGLPIGRQCMNLNLGCADAHLAGFVNVDQRTPADQLADLSEPWPWDDSSVDFIRAVDVIEHLPDKVRTMNEAWRVLIPGGRLEILVPTTDGPGAWQDPTHVSFWNENSFLYYTDQDPHRERGGQWTGIKARFRVLKKELTIDPWKVVKLYILLEAVK